MTRFDLAPVSVTLALTVLASSAAAQERWVQTFTQADHVTSIAPVSDGMFVTGNALTFDSGIFDVWIARLDASGTPLWERQLETGDWDQAADIAATADGGCIVAGFTRSAGAGALDGWVVKLDAAGAVQWERTYGDAEDNQFSALAISPDGYFVGGSTGPADPDVDAWVLELDLQGDVIWQRRIGGEWDDQLRALVATPDGGVAFTADSRSDFGPKSLGAGGPAVPFFRPWMVKLNGDGVSQWQKTYNFSGGDQWSALVPLSDGFYAVGEILASGFSRGDVWVVRLDTTGNVLWDQRLGDHFGVLFYDGAQDAQATADGGVAVLGSTGTAGAGSQDLWMLKLDASGTLEWEETYGLASYDGANALERTTGGDLLAGGFFGDEAVVMRLGASGATSCDLTSPTGPRIWTTPLQVDAVFAPPVSTSVTPGLSNATPASPSSAGYLCLPASLSFCDAADGSLAACPCGNAGDPTSGCDLAQGTGGVELTVLEQQAGALNRATLMGSGFPAASTPSAVVIRAAGLDPAAPVVFGDGVRCVGLPLVRLGAAFAGAGVSTHTFGHGTMAGTGTFRYQLWFRNTPAMFCTPSAFNLSNGRTLTW